MDRRVSAPTPTLSFELLKHAAGNIDVVQVPYKGGEAPIIAAMFSGDVHIYLGSFLALAQHVQAGKIRLIAVGGAAGLSQPSWRVRVLDGVTSAAKAHAGHVFTVGHSYKLMDQAFYTTPEEPSGWDVTLTGPQAFRFLVRATVSFLVTPLPWEMRSIRELAFLPEHVFWYVLVALLPAGLAAGWRRDPLVTSLLFGYGLPTAAVLALTTGNVGTLLRLRGLVTPYLIWLSVLGLCALVEGWSRQRVRKAPPLGTLASKGLVQ